MRRVARARLAGDAVVVAPALLGLVLESRIGGTLVRGRIAEVEAYREDDPASHTFAGVTARNRVMFGPPGHLYVYLSYGVHHCANVVTGPRGTGAAVLVRAVVPLDGVETMRQRRAGRPDRELANGPGKLCQAFAIGLGSNGADLAAPDGDVRLLDDGYEASGPLRIGRRVGITKAVERPWRFRLPSAASD